MCKKRVLYLQILFVCLFVCFVFVFFSRIEPSPFFDVFIAVAVVGYATQTLDLVLNYDHTGQENGGFLSQIPVVLQIKDGDSTLAFSPNSTPPHSPLPYTVGSGIHLIVPSA